MTKHTPRKARKTHKCGCGRPILPGEVYLDHIASPNHDGLGNKNWWRLAECKDCATKYGRLS